MDDVDAVELRGPQRFSKKVFDEIFRQDSKVPLLLFLIVSISFVWYRLHGYQQVPFALRGFSIELTQQATLTLLDSTITVLFFVLTVFSACCIVHVIVCAYKLMRDTLVECEVEGLNDLMHDFRLRLRALEVTLYANGAMQDIHSVRELILAKKVALALEKRLLEVNALIRGNNSAEYRQARVALQRKIVLNELPETPGLPVDFESDLPSELNLDESIDLLAFTLDNAQDEIPEAEEVHFRLRLRA